MDLWIDRCRCCLSANCEVSLLDKEQNYNEKFYDTTTVHVREDDGLPQKLCNECYSAMISAHQFRKQCIIMNNELKGQLNNKLLELREPNTKLKGIVNKNPAVNDDEYYVVVIDESKDKPKSVDNEVEISEILDMYSVDNFLIYNTAAQVNTPATNLHNEENMENGELDNASFLKQDNVLATILSNDDECMENDEIEALLNRDDGVASGTLPDATPDNEEIVPISTPDNEEIVPISTPDNEEIVPISTPDNDEILENDHLDTESVPQQESSTLAHDFVEQSIDLTDCDTFEHKPTEVFSCNLCKKPYECIEILIGHMLLHVNTKTLIGCPLCNRYMRRNALTQHIKNKHVNTNLRCNICLKLFIDQKDLTSHMLTHRKKEFECDICFKSFYQEITMQTHRLSHLHPYLCDICNKIFKSKTAFIAHKKLNTCIQCKVKEIKKRKKQAVSTNIEDMPIDAGKLLGYVCTECRKVYSVKILLDEHLKSTKCGEAMRKRNWLEKIHKPVETKYYNCSHCNEMFTSREDRFIHEQLHKKPRPFPCQQCSSRFETITDLRAHQVTHVKKKKYGCSICMKFFTLKGNLSIHMRSHKLYAPDI